MLFHEEALHGVQSPEATSFPQAIALASSWNPDLVERVFTTVAAEVRARGAQQVLAPVSTSHASRRVYAALLRDASSARGSNAT